MSVVPRIEKAKLPARLAGAERRGEESRATSPNGDAARLRFCWSGRGAGGAAERHANRGSSRGAGSGVSVGDDGRPSVCQSVIERDIRRRGRNRGTRRVHKSARTGALKCQLRSSCA